MRLKDYPVPADTDYMTNESKASAKAAEASWVESMILEAKSAQVLIEGLAICDDLLPRTKESK